MKAILMAIISSIFAINLTPANAGLIYAVKVSDPVSSNGLAGGPNPYYTAPTVELEFDEFFIHCVTEHNCRWIAWNDQPFIDAPSGHQGYLGPGSYGVDDYITLKVTNPNGVEETHDLDRNDSRGNPIGVQNVILGTKAGSPDVYRWGLYGPDQFLDEAGEFTNFTVPGTYKFDFSFYDSYQYGFGFGFPIWLLIGSSETQECIENCIPELDVTSGRTAISLVVGGVILIEQRRRIRQRCHPLLRGQS